MSRKNPRNPHDDGDATRGGYVLKAKGARLVFALAEEVGTKLTAGGREPIWLVNVRRRLGHGIPPHQRAYGELPKPPLQLEGQLCDWLPSPKQRKRVRKMLGDQQAHIQLLREQSRPWAARWQRGCTWWLMGWDIVRAPLAAVVRAVLGAIERP